MLLSRGPARLLEEWARTVDDYFKSCVELDRLASLGDRVEFDKAQNEARELKLIAGRARRRYRSDLRRSGTISGGTYLEGTVTWRSNRGLSASTRNSH